MCQPMNRRGRQAVAPPRQYEKAIKLLEKRFRSSFFVDQSLTFRASNLSLNRILLKLPKKLLQSRVEIQRVEAKRNPFLYADFCRPVPAQRAKLDVLEFFSVECALQRTEDFPAFLGVFYKRLAVIGKGQRSHPASRQPTEEAPEATSIVHPIPRTHTRLTTRSI